MIRALALTLILSWPGAVCAASKEASSVKILEEYYQQALQFYKEGDYRQAIFKWGEILRVDPEQKTAQTMILEARKQLALTTKKLRERSMSLVAKGAYQKALLDLQALIDLDPSDPNTKSLQNRLEEVVKVAVELPPRDKASRMAILGLKGYLALPGDLKLAYNGLRYARELAPGEENYKKLLELLLFSQPELAEDTVTPGMKLLEYKHFVALHHIYDAKHHLAIVVLNEILALEPHDLTALKRLGSAYYSLGRRDKARDAWVRALKLSPKDKTLKKFMAKLNRKKSISPTPDQNE
ncbi:MAG: hypothetical protein A3J74_07505 [Elusimicrobia bacterium RIFCSPHIGHO2_02_FULL_57_9]|nr:MAG: hypothetical protein A3J74_07505 [Elusimicrobia bacterium RIFCSPHIGHO2_02_FULL_57_9]